MSDALQFETAELPPEPDASAGRTCQLCTTPILDRYYEIGEQTWCVECHAQWDAKRNARGPTGRFVRALVLGTIAGAVGAAIYYAILALTGYELGLVAIVVGVLVGMGVRSGSDGRGGWFYQMLAMSLTYVAITSTYIPFVLEGMEGEGAELEAMVEDEPPEPDVAAEPPPEPVGAAAREEAELEAPAAGQPSPGTPVEENGAGEERLQDMGVIGKIVFAIIVFVIALLAPVLAGVENIIGLLIIGIALYEAWKINRAGTPTEVRGPFTVGAGP